MSERLDRFDPYHKWLGIPPAEQPLNHYRLLARRNSSDILTRGSDSHLAARGARPQRSDRPWLYEREAETRVLPAEPAHVRYNHGKV